MDHPPGEETTRCPVCGTVLQPGLATCAACGTPLAGMFTTPATVSDATLTSGSPMPADPLATSMALDSASAALATDASSDPARSASTGTEDAWRCDWCGETNPAGTDQCAHCGALFPRPEADAALTRLAQERMAAELSTLGTMQRRRQRKGLGRLFSN